MPNVTYWTNKPRPKTEISETHKIYKTHRNPISLCTAYPKHEYGPINNTMTLLKHINKASLLFPYEQLCIQPYHQQKWLILEQCIGEKKSHISAETWHIPYVTSHEYIRSISHEQHNYISSILIPLARSQHNLVRKNRIILYRQNLLHFLEYFYYFNFYIT
jgi:hypothetical protein